RRLRNQQRDMGYLVINRSEYLKTAQASSQEVEAYYNDHRQEFMNPEQVRVEYVELKLEEMAARYPVSEQDIEKKYQAERNSYVINKEQRRAGHILIIVDKKTTEEAAKQKIAGILKEVKAGKDFAKLAKQHSQDPGSAKKGGDLGFFGRNVMDKAFEESAFSLKKGSVSEPVRSKYGYHLIKLTDIKPEKVKPLQAVREQIKKSLQIQQAQSDFGTDTSKLDLLSFEKPDSLSPVVEELGLTIKTSGFFTRQGGTGIAADPRVVQAAFSEEVLTGGKNSKMLELGEHALVLRIKEHKPASQRSLQEVTPLLQTRLKTQAAAAMVKETSDKVLARLQGGESPEQVVKSIKGAKWVKTGPIFRSAELDTVPLAKQVPHEIRRFGFTLPKPDAGKTSWGNTATGTGDGVVVGLFAVQVSDTKADKAKQQQEVLALTNFQGRAMLDHLLKQLHKDAKISINLPKDE
ncbi:MAG: peptidylprolyl isomerase, partial [Gammaproteobacteria bacterium]|nr:peptidylprolyl isomerase [Gammaproteobacteria bacterium]